jgi:cytidine deaminase
MQKKIEFEYDLLVDASGLSVEDQQLLEAAKNATKSAYAPYSNFQVGAAARLSNGNIQIGSNQESASFPVGICAERTLLNSIGSQFPDLSILTMAVTYQPIGKESNAPISPCGMCRQSLLDFEQRYGVPIKLILAGMSGEVMVIHSASNLLPFGFDGSILK